MTKTTSLPSEIFASLPTPAVQLLYSELVGTIYVVQFDCLKSFHPDASHDLG
jgi:hypothetical protein